MYLTTEQFRAAEEQTLASQRFKALKQEKKQDCNGECYVCGYDYLERGGWLEANHVEYRRPDGSLIFGRETKADLVLLCGNKDRRFAHHRPGRMTKEQCKAWRSYYRTRKRMAWCIKLPFRIVRFFWRLLIALIFKR